MRQLLKYMLSFCHKCGAIDEFSVQCSKKDTNYLLKYTCPKCNYVNEIIASSDDIKDYLSKQEKI